MDTAVRRLGANQYSVAINGDTKTVNLDGLTVMSDEDYSALETAGLVDDDTMMCPSISEDSEDDPFFRAAVDEAANYSGFNAEDYVRDNTTV